MVKIKHSHLYGIKTIDQLNEILLLDLYFDKLPFNVNRLYKTYKIQKKRLVEEPSYRLSQVQKRLVILLKQIQVPDYIFTFRSFIHNAEYHRYSTEASTLDVTKFFPSAKAGRVFQLFHLTFNCSKEVSYKLTQICTYEGHLPTGAPTSPMLGYWAYRDMWGQIHQLHKKYGLKDSVYVDDVTVSGDFIPYEVKAITKKILRKNGLKTNSKEQYYCAGENKIITGVEILPDGTLVPPDRIYEKEQYLQSLIRDVNDVEEISKVEQRLWGLQNYKSQVESSNRPRLSHAS